MDLHHIILVFLVILLTQCGDHMVRCVITDVRLVGGPTSNKGTVEIKQDNGSWETTCGVNLGINDVIVICRQLGFTGASRAIENTPYAQNLDPTKGLQCNGDEIVISQCSLLQSESCMISGAATCHGEGYLGCFEDNVNNVRVFPGENLINYPMMTISHCIQFCINVPTTTTYAYAGVENGNECYCGKVGDEYNEIGTGTDAMCTSPCSGDPTESCGGAGNGKGFIAVYNIMNNVMTSSEVTSLSTPQEDTYVPSSPDPAGVTNIGKDTPKTTSSMIFTTHQAPATLPPGEGNTALYAGIGGSVAAVITIVAIPVVFCIVRRRSQKTGKNLTSSQRMSLAPTGTPAGINGLGITNAAVEETSAAGGSQLGLQASNDAAASFTTASGGDKSGLVVNLNPNKSMNIYEGMVDGVQGDEMMPYASFDTAATVQNNNGRLSVVYAMPDKNGNEPRNDYEGITNDLAPYASVDNVSPMRPRTMPNMNDRLSVVYAAPDKNGNGHRNDTSEDFGSLYSIPDKPRGQPDGNDDGIVHGLYAKADKSFSGDQDEQDMVENELYTI